MSFIKVTPEGAVTTVDPAADETNTTGMLRFLYREIECRWVEAIRFSGDLMMFMDEEGAMSADAVPNPLAVRLLASQGAPVAIIYGNVLIGRATHDGRTESPTPGQERGLLAWLTERGAIV